MKRLLLVGGVGSIAPQYQQAAEAHGYALTFVEKGQRLAPTVADLVLVNVTTINHSLRDHAVELARACRARVIYLRSASISALRRALEAA